MRSELNDDWSELGDGWEEKLSVEIIWTDLRFSLKDEGALSEFYKRRWKKKRVLILMFKMGKEVFGLIDVADPRFYRVYDQFIVWYGNSWMYANTVLMPQNKLIKYLINVLNYNWHSMEVKIT